MPDTALPKPWSEVNQLAHYERRYVDVIQRPMTGHVTITPTVVHKLGEAVAIPVKVELVGGVLSVDLPAGQYELDASLMTIEQRRTKDLTQITLSV